jgi:hypothetical protein
MDNGRNQVNGFNSEVFQGQTPNNDVFVPNHDPRSVGNQALNLNNAPENAQTIEETPFSGEQPLGEIIEVPGGAPESVAYEEPLEPIFTDKKRGFTGVKTIDDTLYQFNKIDKDPSRLNNIIRLKRMRENVQSITGSDPVPGAEKAA